MAELSFIHRFEPGTRSAAHPLLLLHGTGGNEDDLLPLGRLVAPQAPLLSPRGKILERGMPRFFRRLAEGVFDERDVRERAHELADFVEAARKAYDLKAPISLGYSNGANIAAAVLLVRPDVLAGSILLRAVVPLRHEAGAGSLAGSEVLIISGAADLIAPPAAGLDLKRLLEAAGAQVEHRTVATGHELSQHDVDLARQWMHARETTFPPAP